MVIDDLSEGSLKNLEKHRNDPKFDFVRGDIRDKNIIMRAAANKECLFHMAAISRIQPSITDPAKTFDVNVQGTLNVLEAARANNVKRVVFSASSSVYGMINKDFWSMPLKESMPTDCMNPYSLSKRTGEELMELYRKLYGISTVSLRYFNVMGPRHPEDGSYATVVAIFRKQKRLKEKLTVVGSGQKRRDMTFVSDVVRANMMAMMNREATGIINIGTGKNISILELAQKIDKDNIVHIEDRVGEAMSTLADITKAKTVLGWTPTVDLDNGLKILDMFEERNNPNKIILVNA